MSNTSDGISSVAIAMALKITAIITVIVEKMNFMVSPLIGSKLNPNPSGSRELNRKQPNSP